MIFFFVRRKFYFIAHPILLRIQFYCASNFIAHPILLRIQFIFEIKRSINFIILKLSYNKTYYVNVYPIFSQKCSTKNFILLKMYSILQLQYLYIYINAKYLYYLDKSASRLK